MLGLVTIPVASQFANKDGNETVDRIIIIKKTIENKY